MSTFRIALANIRFPAAHPRGEIRLRTRTIAIPSPIDVRSVRENSGCHSPSPPSVLCHGRG